MGWTCLSPAQLAGLGPARPQNTGRRICWAGISPLCLWACVGPNPHALIIFNYLIINNNDNNNKTKIFQKNFKIPFKKIVIFLNVFLPILFNIGLYTYTVRYKSGIKIPGFLQNIFKIIIIIIILFSCIQLNPKKF